MPTPNKKGRPAGTGATPKTSAFSHRTTAPIVTGQCAQVLNLIRKRRAVLSFTLTAECAIPEAAARVHDLRGMGFHVLTTILPEVLFRGQVRRNVALYSLGTPEWPAPGFLQEGER